MRWSLHSWRLAEQTPPGEPGGDAMVELPWCDAPASLIVARVDLTARLCHARVGTAPPVMVVGLDGDLDCWWSEPVPARSPFLSQSPRRWSLPGGVDLGALTTDSRRGTPSLHLVTTVGSATDHRLVLVDLDHWGALGVEATPALARGVVRAIAEGFGAPPLATPPTIWWGGVRPHRAVTSSDPGDYFDDADTALEALAITTATCAVAVVDGASPAMPQRRSGRAVVSTGRPAGGLWLVERKGRWMLEPLHLEVVPVGLEGIDLPDSSGDATDKEHNMTTSAHASTSVHRLSPGGVQTARTVRSHERAWPLMVSVLGAPRVLDRRLRPVEFERSKALELVTWLALHRPRCTRSGVRSALWDLPIRDGSFANIVCEARRSLAEAVAVPPGGDWIGRGLGDDLPLHPQVVTDADLLRSALRSAHGNAEPASGQHLRDMLQLVRGVPFEGTNYLWADAEGLTSELTMLIVQAAAASARRHLEMGDVDGVFESTAVGLRVVPRHEELVALRLRAHHRSGDDAGVRQEWASYERALALDPFSSRPSTKLLALRQELLRRPVSA